MISNRKLSRPAGICLVVLLGVVAASSVLAKGSEDNPTFVTIDQSGDGNNVDVNSLPAVQIDQTGTNNDVDVQSLPAVQIDQTGGNNDVDIQSLPAVQIDPAANAVDANITGGNVGVTGTVGISGPAEVVNPQGQVLEVNVGGGNVDVSGSIGIDPTANTVKLDGVVDAFVINGAPHPDDLVILRSTNQPVEGTECGNLEVPVVRAFATSSENGQPFVVPQGRRLIVTDFTWAADLTGGAQAFANAASGVLSLGPSLYASRYVRIQEGDLFVGDSEHFSTGLTMRAGFEVCIGGFFIRASDGLRFFAKPAERGNFVNGYLVDE